MVLKMQVFKDYGKYYDILYQDKNYEEECNFIEEIFRRYSQKEIKTILDAGCGTGGHAIPMAKRGYKVVGFDASEVMTERAKEKARGLNNIRFKIMDIRDFHISEKFDACICMFAVIDYITETKDILKALRTIRRHLKENSLFIFDFWNGLAVLRILPSVRVKIMESGGIKVIRTVEPELDAFNHINKSHYRMIVIKDGEVVDEIEETHVIRFYFPREIKHYLEDAGFELIKICPFMDLEGKVDENVWNIMAIAKARAEEGER